VNATRFKFGAWLVALTLGAVIGFRVFFEIPENLTEASDHVIAKRTPASPTNSSRIRDDEDVALRASRQNLRKIDFAKLNESLNGPNGLNSCGKFLKNELEETGDYGTMTRFLSTLSAADAKSLLKSWIFGTETPFGALEDLRAQEKAVTRLGFSEDMVLTDRLFRLSGGAAFPDLEPGRDIDLKKTRAFENAAVGSTEKHGVSTTVRAFQGFLADDATAIAVQRSLSRLITSHPQEAAIAIGQLEPGRPKDLMIKTLVEWMKKKGEVEALEDWIHEISDENIKASVK
jgi:hypothetical protein